jgi:acyl-CoA thioester hydrolase
VLSPGSGGELPLQGAARYDDLLTLETRVLNQRTSVIRFGYRLLRPTPDGEPVLLAEGETVHVVVDRTMQKTKLPERFATALRGMGAIPVQE